MLEGGELCVTEYSEVLVVEGVFHRPALVILESVFLVFPEEFLLAKGGHTHQYGGHSTSVGRLYEWDQVDDRILRRRQDKVDMAVLAPSTGAIDICRVISEDMMCVSDGGVIRFAWMLGDGWL